MGWALRPDLPRTSIPPPRGYSSLRAHRTSSPGSDYFLTTNLHPRLPLFRPPPVQAMLLEHLLRLEAEDIWTLLAAVVMPDHLHLLVRLHARRSLAGAMRLGKGRLVPWLRQRGGGWQAGYYDHRLRGGEDLFPVLLYLYLNPYRAGLLAKEERWPGFYCRAEEWEWFGLRTAEGVPMPEWLGE